MIPRRTLEAFSFSPYCVAICTAPWFINTMPKETATIINVLNLESHATMIAVNPRPPAVAVEIVWLAPLTITKPAIPQIAPEIAASDAQLVAEITKQVMAQLGMK